MGLGQSKDEMLFSAAQKGDVHAIKELRQQGASLEWTDQKGRTPLIVACSYPEGYDSAVTLLQLGANLRAYRHGPEGGFPVHHAAKRGLDRTLVLLLQHGAEPLVVNDVGQTPLGMAREKGNVSTVRLIEDRIGLFSGNMRQQMVTAPGFIEVIASSWVYKKVWVVVVPANVDPRRPPRFELVIYSSAKAAVPITTVPLEHAQLSVAKPETNDPVLVVEDTYSTVKFKLLGDKDSPNSASHVQRLFNACRGIPQNAAPAGVPTWQHPQPYTWPSPTPGQPPSGVSASGYGSTSGNPEKVSEEDDIALKLAIEESLRTAAAESSRHDGPSRSGGYGGWGGEAVGSYGGWGPSDRQQQPPQRTPPPAPMVRSTSVPNSRSSAPPSRTGSAGNSDWVPTEEGSYNGWGSPRTPRTPGGSQATPPSRPAPPTPASPAASTPSSVNWSPTPPPEASPSAPPMPVQLAESIRYPSINTTPVQVPVAPSVPAASPAPPAASGDSGAGGSGSKCVICWDAPPEAVCIPCGHLAGCMECLGEIKEKNWGCPVCRASIREIIKVYQV